MKRFAQFNIFVFLFLCHSIAAAAVESAEVVSVRPGAYITVEAERRDAAVGQDVFHGNRLETDKYGRMSLLLPDHALLKIGSDTRFVYQGEEKEGRKWFLDRGKVWLRGLFRKTRFNVQTPTAIIGVRGTEWYMTVDGDGTTTVGVVDGRVKVENRFGSLTLASREMATVQPGRPPVKSAYLMPENAVNWTLKYRGLWDQTDIFRSGKALGDTIQAVIKAYSLNDLAAAYEYLNQAEVSFGKTAPWRAMAGFLELVSGNDLAARKYFGSAATADPAWALPHAHLSLMNLVENKISLARKEAELALQLEPKSAVALLSMAYVLKAELQLDEAYELTKQAVILSPDFHQAALIAATIALEMEDYRQCRRLLERLPEDPSIMSERETVFGYLHFREGRNKEAVEHFKAAVTADPDEPDSWMGLGLSLFRLNRVEEGLSAIIKAALIAPQVSAYQSYLAKAFFELDLKDEAMASLARAKRLDPKDPTPHLYEGLWAYENRRPGEAIQYLENARRLNDYRAVFRSRYLLDQDNAVLMANVSKIYDQLGFDNSSIQEAARALEINPANEAAHRRLYYALIFEPEFHQQAASTELLLAKLFVPPTKNAVVFDEGSLSPYQGMFDRSGFDGTLFGGYFHYADQDLENKSPFGTLSVAGQLDSPFAFHSQVSPNYNESKLKTDTTDTSSGLTTISSQRLDQEQRLMTYTTFMKWQPNSNFGMFLDGRLSDSSLDISSSNETSMLTDSTVISSGRTTSDGETDVTLGDFDTGMNAQFFGGLKGLFHVSYHDETSDSGTATVSDFSSFASTTSLTSGQDNTHWIVQGAVWNNWSDHNIQLGGRYFTQDITSASETEIGTFTSKFEQSEDFEFLSGFLFHQYWITDDLHWLGGLTLDQSRYTSPSDNEHSRTTANPVAGLSWDVHPSWRIRAAYIQNAVGDRNERLQPAMVAGFPLLRVSQLDAFTSEQLLHAQHKVLAGGIDYRSTGHPLFCGAEVEYSRANTEYFDPADPDEIIDIDNDILNLRAYFETLITTDLSTALTYRFMDYEFPDREYENRLDWNAAYFFKNLLFFNLNAIYKNIRPKSGALDRTEEKSLTIEPGIEIYLLNNKLQLNLTGHLEQRNTENGPDEDNNTIRWIRAGIAYYF